MLASHRGGPGSIRGRDMSVSRQTAKLVDVVPYPFWLAYLSLILSGIGNTDQYPDAAKSLKITTSDCGTLMLISSLVFYRTSSILLWHCLFEILFINNRSVADLGPLSRIWSFPSQIQVKKIPGSGSGSASKNLSTVPTFHPKICFLAHGKMIMDVYPDPDFFPIPEP